MTLSASEFGKYRDLLMKINTRAADEFRDAVWKANGKFGGVGLGNIPADDIIAYAYELITKYGEASGALAAEFYDELAELSGVAVPAAVPAATSSYQDVATMVHGILKQSLNEEVMAAGVSRHVKMPAEDTMIQNAIRDGAQLAWIPHGATCAYCISLASRGWQYASKTMLKNGHAEHIHGNCDCCHAVRFDNEFSVAGYNPSRYLKMYETADPWAHNPKDKINALRREIYAQNAEEINAQKRSAYAKSKEIEASRAEEADVGN